MKKLTYYRDTTNNNMSSKSIYKALDPSNQI